MKVQSDKPVILVVDDEFDDICLLSFILSDIYTVDSCLSGTGALERCSLPDKPDLILLDILMPGIDGFETCRQLKANPETADIPVLFLTAKGSIMDESAGFEAGGEDYIVKPVQPEIVRARVNAHIRLKKNREFLTKRNSEMESGILQRMLEINEIEDGILMALGSLAETRDTGNTRNISRVHALTGILVEKLVSVSFYASQLDPKTIHCIIQAAPLHDIGKVGIPDVILNKTSPLTPEEYDIIKNHTVIGYNALDHAELNLGYKNKSLAIVKDIVLYHHEKWDGTGYPKGLRGKDIPLSARIMSIIDVFDSMISDKPFRNRFSPAQAAETIIRESGTFFDPDIVGIFTNHKDRFMEIAEKNND